jgi:proteasome assembly chaperone 4
MAASIAQISSHFIPPLNSSSPALAFQVTSLVDSYMIWAGIMEGNAEDVHNAASRGRLTQDWACAMPSLKVLIKSYKSLSYFIQSLLYSKASVPASATSLFRTSSADVALPMAQRIGMADFLESKV